MSLLLIIICIVDWILKACESVWEYFVPVHTEVNITYKRQYDKVPETDDFHIERETRQSPRIRIPLVRLSSYRVLELRESIFDESVFVGTQTIENIFDSPVYFNVKAHHPNVFIVKPRKGIIQPGDSVEVTFYLKTDMQGERKYEPEAVKVFTRVVENCDTPNNSMINVWTPMPSFVTQKTKFYCRPRLKFDDFSDLDDDDEDDGINSLPYREILLALVTSVLIMGAYYWFFYIPLERKIVALKEAQRCRRFYSFLPFASVLAGFFDCSGQSLDLAAETATSPFHYILSEVCTSLFSRLYATLITICQ